MAETTRVTPDRQKCYRRDVLNYGAPSTECGRGCMLARNGYDREVYGALCSLAPVAPPEGGEHEG